MVKIAIVGTGIIGLSHIKALSEIKEAKLVALCDINEAAVSALAKEYGVPYFTDYKDIPGGVECDAVILNLPHGLHAESTVFFLESGINVLIEKPMANTAEECHAMLAAARSSGKHLAVAHPQRHFGAIAKVKEIFDSGELGEFCMCTGQRSINYFRDDRPRWFLSKKLAGGGIVMNYGAHELDKIQYITGKRVEKVYSSCQNIKNDYDIEGHAQIFGKLSGGATFSLTFSGYSNVVYDNYYYFTNGAMRVLGSRQLEINRGGGWESVTIDTEGEGIKREVVEFIKLLSGECANIADAEYGKDIIEAIEKIYESQI